MIRTERHEKLVPVTTHQLVGNGGAISFDEADWQGFVAYIRERDYLKSWTEGPIKKLAQALKYCDERSA